MNNLLFTHLAGILDNMPLALFDSLPFALVAVILGLGAFVILAAIYVVLTCYRKVEKGTALIRTGMGGTKVYFNAGYIVPILHRADMMDISLKRIEIDRTGRNGLICKDNMRADIKVAFFVRVNNAAEDVLRVAESVGCARASSEDEIRTLFDAKFSEALKTVGKRFEFTSLYEDRDTFRDEILKVIGTDLNGFVLDDAAIDFLEQTPIEMLDPDNILDAEGIKKITHLTAEQAKLSNHIERDKQRVIKQQDVEAREAILELERQLAETEAKQQREVKTVQAREEAETAKVSEEQRQRSEQARIAAEEEIEIADENKQRQVIVALRNKERTDGVELERVERERMLEEIERKRVTELKSIEAEKLIEVQKKEIQEVIRERVAVEKGVVEEQQRIKDTEEFATADRQKQVTVTLAEAQAQEKMIGRIKEAEAQKESAQLAADEHAYEVIKEAEAGRQAAEMNAEQRIISAEAEQTAAEKESSAKKMMAEAIAKEAAATGLGEAEVLKAMGMADAEAIELKAAAMKLFEEAGQEHEEFKLELDKEKAVELAEIDVQRQIAAEQAKVVGEALKSANIDIVGGETQFFDRITNAITNGKVVDRMVDNSRVIDDVKETFFNGDPEYFKSQLSGWIQDFGIETEDLKNLSVSALLGKLVKDASGDQRTKMIGMLGAAERFGLSDAKAGDLLKKLG
ncbi:MAG: flotillin family protein [Roseibacillus sp.]